MRKQALAFMLVCLSAGALSAGFSLGRPAAVKKQVSKLDDKVRAKLAASGPSAPAANHAPTVASVTAVSTTVAAGGLARLSVSAADADGDALSYVWSSTAGALGGAGTSVNWLAPSTPGVYAVNCVVSDGEDTAPGTLLVTAVSPGTPKFKFAPTVAANFLLAPAVSSGGIVYAAADDGRLFAIDANGGEKWVFSTDSLDLFDSAPLVAEDGTIYILAGGNKTYAVKPDGTVKWAAPFVAPNNPSDPPVVGKDGTVYVLDDTDNILYAVDGNGVGVATFTALVGVMFTGPPVIGKDGTIYLLDGGDILHAVSPEGLANSTDTDLTGISGIPPAVGGDGSFYWVDSNADLYGRHADGTVYWGPYTPVSGGVINDAPVIGSDGAIYLYDDTLALNKISSTSIADLPFAPATDFTAVDFQAVPGPDGAVYVVDSNTDLYGIRSDGTVAWGPRTPDVVPANVINTAPGVGADGTVAFVSDDGSVYAFYSTAALP